MDSQDLTAYKDKSKTFFPNLVENLPGKTRFASRLESTVWALKWHFHDETGLTFKFLLSIFLLKTVCYSPKLSGLFIIAITIPKGIHFQNPFHSIESHTTFDIVQQRKTNACSKLIKTDFVMLDETLILFILVMKVYFINAVWKVADFDMIKFHLQIWKCRS